MPQDIKQYFEEHARSGNGQFAIAYALLTLAERGAPGLGTWGNPPGGSGIQPESLAHHLMTLAMLREQGALTEEEFAAQKAKLLG